MPEWLTILTSRFYCNSPERRTFFSSSSSVRLPSSSSAASSKRTRFVCVERAQFVCVFGLSFVFVFSSSASSSSVCLPNGERSRLSSTTLNSRTANDQVTLNPRQSPSTPQPSDSNEGGCLGISLKIKRAPQICPISFVERSKTGDGGIERASMAEEFPQTVPASPSQISKEGGLKQTQVSGFSSFPTFPNGDMQTFPIMYPTLLPGFPPLQNHEQMNRGAGIYAVPTFPYMGPVTGLPFNALIPFTYNTPTATVSSQRPTPEAGVVQAEHGQAGEEQQHQPQPHPPQRQVVVRRFHIAIQLDLFLILKLAAVIFLFNQDGSRQRLVVLVFFASLVYFYQTGALAPLIRWLSQGMHRAAAPPNPPRPAVRPENAPPVGRQENDNVAVAEREGGAENRPANEGPEAVENENAAENGGGNHLWGVLREIQMIVFGFITSLLPGFHNID